MARAKRVALKTRWPGIYRIPRQDGPDRFEWRTRHASGTVDTAEEARAAKARAELAGPTASATREAFGTYARSWLAGYPGRTSRGLSEVTREGYRESLDLYAIPYFEGRGLKPHRITPRHVRDFVAWLAAEPTAKERRAEIALGRPLARRTIVKHLAPLKAMFAQAVEDGELPKNVALVRVNVAGESAADGKARAFTDEQLAAILAAAAEGDRLLLDVVAATGARWGEVVEWRGKDLGNVGGRPVLRVRRAFSNKVRDADGKRAEIVKLPKSSKGRRDLPLDPELARRLWRLQRGPEELLFVDPVRGGRMDYDRTRRSVLAPALERASGKLDEGVSWGTWHVFRHTLASRMLAAGRSVKQVQEWLGHHKASFTLDTYVHLMAEGIGAPLALPVAGTNGDQRGTNGQPETAGTARAAIGANRPDLRDTPETPVAATADS